MKNTKLVSAILVLTLACSACRQNDSMLSNEDVNQINGAVNQSFSRLAAAAQALDADAYFEHFDKQRFTALNADGTVAHSFEVFEKATRQQFAALESYRLLEFSKVKISVINRSAVILVNEYQADVVLKSGEMVSAGGGGTQVWAYTDGMWKLVSVSSSVK